MSRIDGVFCVCMVFVGMREGVTLSRGNSVRVGLVVRVDSNRAGYLAFSDVQGLFVFPSSFVPVASEE